MIPLPKHILFYIAIFLNVREASVLRRQRRDIVPRGNVAVGHWGIFGGLVGVVPVSTGNVVALENVHVKASVLELAIGNETSVKIRALSARGHDDETRKYVPDTSSNNSHSADGPFQLVELGLGSARAFVEHGRLLRDARQHRGASEEHKAADPHHE